MAVAVGERFVRRHNAARTSTANTTAADITYDTAVLNEGTGYTYTGPHVAADTAGLYLFIFDLGQCDLASTRACGTLLPRINGTTDKTRFRASHRYLRNSDACQSGASIGMCILDLAANDNVRVRNPGAVDQTDAVGNYATNSGAGGGMQLLRLPANSLTHVERTSNAAEVGTSNIQSTRPWLDGSGTWTTITYNSEVQDDDSLYPGSGGDLTLAADTKYLVVWGASIYSTDSSRHTDVVRLQINSVNVQTGSGYQRNASSQGPPMCGMYLHETGGSTETLRLQATHETDGGDAGTPQVRAAYVQVFTLPSSAEWIHVDNGTTDSLDTALAGTTTWYDTPLSSTFRADGNSDLSLDSANDAVQNDSGGSLPVLAIGWHRWDKDIQNSQRKQPWTRWDNGGSNVYYGVAGAFSRGTQNSDDTQQAHYTSAALLDLANAADLSFQVNEPDDGANSGMGIYASTSRHFLGVQVLNLDTLVAGVTQDLDAGAITCTSSVTAGDLTAISYHNLDAGAVTAISSVTACSLTAIGYHDLDAGAVTAVSSVTAGGLTSQQTRNLTAGAITAVSNITAGGVDLTIPVDAGAITCTSSVTAGSVIAEQTHNIDAGAITCTSSVTAGTLTAEQTHSIDAGDISVVSSVTAGGVSQSLRTTIAKLGLSNPGQATKTGSHILHVRARESSGQARLETSIRELTSEIVTYTDTLTGSFQTFEHDFSAQAGSIGNYDNLQIWLTGIGDGLAAFNVEVSWVQVQVPKGAAAVANLTAGAITVVSSVTAGDVDKTIPIDAGDITCISSVTAGGVDLVKPVDAGDITVISSVTAGGVDLSKKLAAGAITCVSSVTAGDVDLSKKLGAGAITCTSSVTAGDVDLSIPVDAGAITCVSSVTSAGLTAFKVSNLAAGAITSVSSVAGGVDLQIDLNSGPITAVSAVSAGLTAEQTHSVVAGAITAVSTVAGAVTSVSAGVTRNLNAGAVTATSGVTAGDVDCGKKLDAGAVTTTSAVTAGGVDCTKPLTAGAAASTSTVTAGLTAAQTHSIDAGAVTVVSAVTGGGVTAEQTHSLNASVAAAVSVSAALKVVKSINAGPIAAVASVTGGLAVATIRPLVGSAAAVSVVTAALSIQPELLLLGLSDAVAYGLALTDVVSAGLVLSDESTGVALTDESRGVALTDEASAGLTVSEVGDT